MVIQGIVTWALHKYTPPSSCRTGENVRVSEVTVPVVSIKYALIRTPASTFEPFG